MGTSTPVKHTLLRPRGRRLPGSFRDTRVTDGATGLVTIPRPGRVHEGQQMRPTAASRGRYVVGRLETEPFVLPLSGHSSGCVLFPIK